MWWQDCIKKKNVNFSSSVENRLRRHKPGNQYQDTKWEAISYFHKEGDDEDRIHRNILNSESEFYT